MVWWHASAVTHSAEEEKGEIQLYLATREEVAQPGKRESLVDPCVSQTFPRTRCLDTGREGQFTDDAAATLSCFVVLQLLVCEEQLAHNNNHTHFPVIPEKQPLLCRV